MTENNSDWFWGNDDTWMSNPVGDWVTKTTGEQIKVFKKDEIKYDSTGKRKSIEKGILFAKNIKTGNTFKLTSDWNKLNTFKRV